MVGRPPCWRLTAGGLHEVRLVAAIQVSPHRWASSVVVAVGGLVDAGVGGCAIEMGWELG